MEGRQIKLGLAFPLTWQLAGLHTIIIIIINNDDIDDHSYLDYQNIIK